MSWAVDRARTPKRQRPGTEESAVNRNVNFDEYVTKKYNELLAKIGKETEEMEIKITTLLNEEKKISESQSRGLIRRKIQITRELQKLRDKLDENKRGVRIEEFKKKIMPYAEAYERELQVAAVERLRNSATQGNHLPNEGDGKTPHGGVMKEFMQEVENIPVEVKVMPNEICEECDDVMVLEARSSTLVCPCCGNWKYYLDATSSHMAYGEEVEFTAFAYLRMNHFNEKLTYSQAKESTRIAVEDIQRVMDRLIEKRITDVNKITLDMTHAVAKELKMRHVYKQNTQLWCRITGKPPLRMTPEQEEKMRAMFRAVNNVWMKHKPDDRKNFLSYSSLCFSFCQLLGLDQFLPLYRLLKGMHLLLAPYVGTFVFLCVRIEKITKTTGNLQSHL